MGAQSAASVAVELLRIPSRLRQVRSAPLPADTTLVLQIVAGEADAVAEATRLTGRTPQELREASEFFVEQALFHPGADSYRVLGATAAAPIGDLRRNMALLLRWLHPDIHRKSERSVFAGRVTEAWEHVKTPERRQAYDLSLRAQSERQQPSRSGANGSARVRPRGPARPPHLHGQHASAGHRPRGLLRRLLGALFSRPGSR